MFYHPVNGPRNTSSSRVKYSRGIIAASSVTLIQSQEEVEAVVFVIVGTGIGVEGGVLRLDVRFLGGAFAGFS